MTAAGSVRPTPQIISPDALRRMVTVPGELGLGRAYVAGEIDVGGDIYAALSALRARMPAVRVRPREIARLARLLGEDALRHVWAPDAGARRSNLGDGLVPIRLEVPHPLPQGEPVVLAEALHMADLEPRPCIVDTMAPTSCAGGFGIPQDVDRSFARLVEMFDAALRTRRPRAEPDSDRRAGLRPPGSLA